MEEKYTSDKSDFVITNGVLKKYKGDDENVVIPEGVTSIGNWAFADCYKLTSITIPNSVSCIGDEAFRGCSELSDITLPDSVISIGDDAFLGCESLRSITIPDSVTSIGARAFCGCSELRNITIPDSVTSINGNVLPLSSNQIILHINDISKVSARFRSSAAVGFAEDARDCTDENGRSYLKYIKNNVVKLTRRAIQHPALFDLMIREKLIDAGDFEAVMNAVQKSRKAELIAAIQAYGSSAVSEKDKEKVQKKRDEYEKNVTGSIINEKKQEQISGKTFIAAGRLKTFANRDELERCLTIFGAKLKEKPVADVDYFITNEPDADTVKNRKAIELGIKHITEEEFNQMVGRPV